MTLSSRRVFDHVAFLSEHRSMVELDDVFFHFRMPGDNYDEDQVDEVLRSLAVGGFVTLCRPWVMLTGRRFPGSYARMPGDAEHEAALARRGRSQVRAAAGVVIGADDDGLLLCAGPGAQGWDPDARGADDTAAYFDAEDLPALRRAIEVTARQARFGREYEIPVSGSDIGDVVLATRGEQVLLTVRPYGWDRETFDQEHGNPDDDVPVDYDDEAGNTVPFTPDERHDMLMDARREHEQKWQNVLADRPDLSVLIDQDQVDQLLAALQPGPVRQPPSGVPDL